MLLATTQVEDVDRFMEVFSAKGEAPVSDSSTPRDPVSSAKSSEVRRRPLD